MKKAKIFLAALVVIALVGGTLAFKAKSANNLNGSFLYYCVFGEYCTLYKIDDIVVNVRYAKQDDPGPVVVDGILTNNPNTPVTSPCEGNCLGNFLSITVE